MSVQSTNSGFYQFFHSIREGLGRYLPESSYEAQIILESSALVQISYCSFKNGPFALKAEDFGINTVLHSLSSRIDFIESTLICIVSLIHHVAFALFYTLGVVLTVGLSEHVNFRCGLHWTHSTYGFLCSGIGMMGCVSPYLGFGLNYMLILSIWRGAKGCYDHDVYHFERPLITKIRDIFQDNKAFIYNTIRERVKDESHYKNYEEKSLDHIEKKIYTAEKMDDLITLLIDIRDTWPKVGFESFSVDPELKL